ncbi:MAG: M28 family peptidase, partial [Thermodesulfobacteriota bacterium]
MARPCVPAPAVPLQPRKDEAKPQHDRSHARRLLRATLLALAAAAAACSDSGSGTSRTGTVREELLTDSATMMGWIAEVTAQGIRRPGYPADEWIEGWARDQFLALGLEEVTLDPVAVKRWEPLGCALEAWHEDAPDERLALPCYPVPFTAATDGLEGELVLTDLAEGAGQDLAGSIALVEDRLLELPLTVYTALFARWWHDPAGEFTTAVQTLPFSSRLGGGIEAAAESGAVAFVGIVGAPWETDQYYVPYDAVVRPIPGIWLSPANGARLLDFRAGRATRARLVLERDLRDATSHNVTGVLRGASDEWVIIGSHHDGPWASAVEDASGVALVLAQARYWAQVPERERPHNLLFLLNGGHMSGGAGLIHFTTTRRDFISNEVVVEVHLEHAAREARAEDGRLVPTDAPEWRWWFTSSLPPLEEVVTGAICAEGLGRSLLMPPEGFPPDSMNPPTDAAFFHPHTPIVSFLTAPMYLFDPADTIDMVHEASLVPLTRATVRIVEGMRGQTAAGLRA